jgi:hypothetical protein
VSRQTDELDQDARRPRPVRLGRPFAPKPLGEKTMHPNPTLEPRLECYGADYALLRPEPEDVRYVITDQGRHALALLRACDRGPTVAEVIASRPIEQRFLTAIAFQSPRTGATYRDGMLRFDHAPRQACRRLSSGPRRPSGGAAPA